jgi:hypothetical protein
VRDSCQVNSSFSRSATQETDLEGSAQTERAVVGQLGRKPLDGELDDVALFGDEVIPPR